MDIIRTGRAAMSVKIYKLKAQVSSNNPKSVLQVVKRFVGGKGLNCYHQRLYYAVE